jgi:hypothetical protein
MRKTPTTSLFASTLLLIKILSVTLTIGFSNLALPQDDLPTLDLSIPLRLDFSGFWEKDFRRSDDWQDELNRTMRIRQEAAARQQSNPSSSSLGISLPPISVGNINLPRSGRRTANIVDLARLAEYISRQTTIEIIQNRNEIRVKREGDADLVCGLENGIMETFRNEHGVEVCGWDGQQLIFQIMLPDDLVVAHRFSVASNNSSLNLVTTITSKNRESFNLRQTYNRYDTPADPFNCEQTLSRGIVCSQSGADR